MPNDHRADWKSAIMMHINTLKIRKLKSVGEVNQQLTRGGSTINSVDPGQINSQCREDQQSIYSVERVNSQCRGSTISVEIIKSMYTVERVNSQCRED